MALNQDDLVTLYRGLADRYDLASNLYRVVGFPMGEFRRTAVDALVLGTGDTVVELGCGTGLNFPFLQRVVGPRGKIIGVDMTDAMLARARQRIDRNGWSNVELVQSDVARYVFPHQVDGILSTFAMEFVPEYDALIGRCSAALRPGRKLVVGDLKLPVGRLARLAPYLLPLARPFGTTMDLVSRRPWDSVDNYLEDTDIRTFYFGYAYLASGRRKMTKSSRGETLPTAGS